ncbi:hypothetical protein A2U01_0102233, partial [Trifolium medium]|nr:hypothetical protein [Trifolium medium]
SGCVDASDPFLFISDFLVAGGGWVVATASLFLGDFLVVNSG